MLNWVEKIEIINHLFEEIIFKKCPLTFIFRFQKVPLTSPSLLEILLTFAILFQKCL